MAVFVPGGQAPVVDLMQDAELGEILGHFHSKSKPAALLCHGPIAVVAAMPCAREFRAASIAGDKPRAVLWRRAGGMPEATSSRRRSISGHSSSRNRELITNQNPCSDRLVGTKLVEALRNT